LDRVVEEARAEHGREVLLAGLGQHVDCVGHLVLTVGVEGHEVAHPGPREGVLDARLERRALTEVHGMAHDLRPGRAGEVPRAVRRAVVDAHDVREGLSHAAHDVADHGGLVEQGDDDPGVRVPALPCFGSGIHGVIVAPGALGPATWAPRWNSVGSARALGAAGPASGARGVDVAAEGRVAASADVADDVVLGPGTSVWHLAQVREGARLGRDCVVGRGAYIGTGVRMGDACKVQNYALVYEPAD